MNELIKYFPRQLSFPERISCKNRQEFFKMFRLYQGVKSKMYYSVYNCDFENTFENVKIDKISFDIDTKDTNKMIENVLKIHKKMYSKDYKHLIIFSTFGFWVYIFTKNYNHIINKKECLTNCHNFIAKKCGLTWGTPETKEIADLDFHIRGDLARVARLPTSYDVERKLFCIPVTIEDLEKGYKYIKEKAKKPCYNFVYYGEKLFDISKFDYIDRKETENINVPEYNYDFKGDIDKLIKDFPSYIQYWLLTPKICTWECRFLFAVYCRHINLPKGICNKIAQKYFGKAPRTDNLGNNYNHFVKVRALDYAYGKNHHFPNVETLYKKGLIKGVSKNDKSIYK